MTAWVAVGLIGGGTAFASRLCSLSRLIGAGMIVAGGMVLAAPAFADEHVLAKDNSEVACTMSKSGLTRVSLKDDRFASVSKLTTGVDTDDFTVVNEPTRGDIYVSVPEAYSRPNVSFFGTTSKGYVYKFSCRLAGDDAQQVFVENKDIGGAAETQVAAVAASPQEAFMKKQKYSFKKGGRHIGRRSDRISSQVRLVNRWLMRTTRTRFMGR